MITATRPIATIDELRDHLQYAIGIELTTIPAYLCALYTIEDGTNTAAYEAIQSVVIEEMLHMALAANVLNAIGGEPATGPVNGGPPPVPIYPTAVPFIARIPEIHLLPYSPEALDEFLAIEYPANDDDAPPAAGGGDQYGSIGAFYAAIETGIRELATPQVFDDAGQTRAGCQLQPGAYYGGAGAMIEVTDQASALNALSAIVREGEGTPASTLIQTPAEQIRAGTDTPGRRPAGYSVDDLDRLPFGWRMYSHYARFREIRAGRHYRPDQTIAEEPLGDILVTDWGSVYPMTPDPTAAAFVGTYAHSAMLQFNATYTRLIDTLYCSFNGHPEALTRAVPMMYELKYGAARLLNTTSPHNSKKTLGPPFEYQPASADA